MPALDAERVRTLLAAHLDVDAAAIGEGTGIGIRSFPNSVRYHRFWAAIGDASGRPLDRKGIDTFGALLQALDALPRSGAAPARVVERSTAAPIPQSIGIDIQDIAEFPEASDYRTDPFYRSTFTEREISASLLSADTRASLAGRFCAKEAIVKADAAYAGVDPRTIEILNTPDGAPMFEGFAISISHSGSFAIAVVLRTNSL